MRNSIHSNSSIKETDIIKKNETEILKSPRIDSVTAEFYQIFKEELNQSFSSSLEELNLLQEIEKKGLLPPHSTILGMCSPCNRASK